MIFFYEWNLFNDLLKIFYEYEFFLLSKNFNNLGYNSNKLKISDLYY